MQTCDSARMVLLPPLPPEIRRALESAIVGERILWAAQPQGRRQWAGFGMWLFAIPWTAFALFWEGASLLPWLASSETPSAIAWSFGIAFPLFGLPFVLVGLWLLWLPIRTMRKASDTVYALTDTRIVAVIVGRTTSVRSVLVRQIGPVERREGRDGWGNLRIQTHSSVDSEGDRRTEKFEMIGVPDVAGLEGRILAMQTR